MSKLPSQSQGPTSSSSFQSSSLNPLPDYGNSNNNNSFSHQFGSLTFSDSQSSKPSSGSVAPGAEDSSGSSQEVTELGTPNGKKYLGNQIEDTLSRTPSSGQGSGSSQSKGKMLRINDVARAQQNLGSSNYHGGSGHSSGRRSQMMNANHLLNFQYDPIARSQPRLPPPRRPQKIKPYNKDLFLQANYKFVVLDTGDYAPESMDPDKMLKWEDIICVRYSSPSPVQCPICLDSPLCPQITSCGRVFCFLCILRYLLMGEEDHKGDCYKRCPLCFVMISQRDLYTIFIEYVKQHSVGDTIDFMLLTREKDSFITFQKDKQVIDDTQNENYDPYLKFTFTSDVELSVRKAISELDGWLAKADSGLVDDLEKLPYVCAAMEQLEHRKRFWNEQQAENGVSVKPTNNSASAKPTNNEKGLQEVLSGEKAASADQGAHGSRHVAMPNDANQQKTSLASGKVDMVESPEHHDATLSSSYSESNGLHRQANGSRDVKDRDSYNFYQAVDGQHLILHPLNMKCLLQHYGSYDMLPTRVHSSQNKWKNLAARDCDPVRIHEKALSIFKPFFFDNIVSAMCEIDMSELLPPDALIPFIDEIKKREKQRKQLAKKERKEKIKAEVLEASAMPILPRFGQSLHDNSPMFSMDDFGALGSSSAMSSSPPTVRGSPPNTGGRMLFSNVARLGYAAAHDSPSLRTEETSSLPKVANDSFGANGSRNAGTPSFANVISTAKFGENTDAPKTNEVGKKGKKQNRVLLSTSGGRRY